MEVADHFKKIGLKPGDYVAHIGNSWWASWARLARLRIIAEITGPKDSVNGYWRYNDEVKKKVLDAFAKTGAKVVVTPMAPNIALKLGWQRIDKTNYFFYDLRKHKLLVQTTK